MDILKWIYIHFYRVFFRNGGEKQGRVGRTIRGFSQRISAAKSFHVGLCRFSLWRRTIYFYFLDNVQNYQISFRNSTRLQKSLWFEMHILQNTKFWNVYWTKFAKYKILKCILDKIWLLLFLSHSTRSLAKANQLTKIIKLRINCAQNHNQITNTGWFF